MCGIFGIYNLNSKSEFDQTKFNKALCMVDHRGPDAKNSLFFDRTFAMGHVRLSIIDLNEENNQPFEVDNRYWIIFNGEVFNYVELREELIKDGYTFRTSGDTEVVIRSFQKWGEDCVKKFNGMWAFAIYDTLDQRLFCSRDRFGVKPFNYAVVNDQFVFSSEIKTILSYFPELRKPNYNVIANFCRRSIGAQIKESWFTNVFRLLPAHNVWIDANGIQMKRYWDYPKLVDERINFDAAVEKYDELLADAVRLRMRSDVPVGFTLSSGLDSTALVCLLNDGDKDNKNTYTAAFPGNNFERSEKNNFKYDVEVDEPALVRKLTAELGLTPTIINIEYDNYVEELGKIIYHLESGHGSPAIFPLYKILGVAAKDVTVVMEGQGADELLGGYVSSIFPIYLIELIRKFKFKAAIKELKAFGKVYSLKTCFMLFVRQSHLEVVKRLYYWISGMNKFFVGKLADYKTIQDYPIEPKGFDSEVNSYLYKAHTGGLVNLLHYGDAISMAHSIESRVPFMDYRLVEYVFTLPAEFKVHNGMGKYLHREAMKGIVPNYILENPLKFGFDSPLAQIIKKDMENSPKDILLSERCLNRGIFSKKALVKAFNEQISGKTDSSRLLFRMLSVELWFREFIDMEPLNNI